jgi:hypothetical protein
MPLTVLKLILDQHIQAKAMQTHAIVSLVKSLEIDANNPWGDCRNDHLPI